MREGGREGGREREREREGEREGGREGMNGACFDEIYINIKRLYTCNSHVYNYTHVHYMYVIHT